MISAARSMILSCCCAALLVGCSSSFDLGDGGPTTTEASTSGDAGPSTWGDLGPIDRRFDSRPSRDKCKRVDLVFAVDDSYSMREEMDAMRGDVFPKLAQALRAIGGGLEDYRVGVIDACPDPASLHTRGESGACNFESKQVWIESSSSALESEFACAGDIWSGDVSCSGNDDDEQPASAAAAALTPPYSTGANAGFVRGDALLVIVALTDEDERARPAATPQQLHDRLVTIKGDVRKMVFLGIGGSSYCSGTYGSAEHAKQLQALTDLFVADKRGVFWDLCQGRLEDGLTAAMQVIEQACDELPTIK